MSRGRTPVRRGSARRFSSRMLAVVLECLGTRLFIDALPGNFCVPGRDGALVFRGEEYCDMWSLKITSRRPIQAPALSVRYNDGITAVGFPGS